VSPNAMTLISLAVGLVGAVFFLRPTAASDTAGALLFLLHSILDGCDGELARLKFQESRWGGLLDFWSDNVVHAAVFAAMAVGWSRSLGETWPLALGASAVAGTFASAYFVYRRTMTRPREGPLYTSVATEGETLLSRAADAASRRDFIYLVLILSALGKARWFLVLAAVGAPVFFLMLTAIASAERRRRLRGYAPPA
jgi:phosphatidylglycerophosphate synthase